MARAAQFDQGFSIRDKSDSKKALFRGDGISWAGYVVWPLFAFIVWEMFTPHLWIVPLAMILGMVAVLHRVCATGIMRRLAHVGFPFYSASENRKKF